MMEYLAVSIIIVVWGLSLKSSFILKSLLHIVISLILFIKGFNILSIVALVFGMVFEILLLHSNEEKQDLSYSKKNTYFKIANILVITSIISFMFMFKENLSIGEKIISNKKIVLPLFILLFSIFLTQRRRQ